MVHTVFDRPERRHGNDNADLSDMQYLFAYAENNAAQGNVPWTIRQTCVFHRYNPAGSGNLWIFFHARPRSKMQQQIEAEITSQHAGVSKRWYSMHLLVLSAYIGNWRWCIRSLGEEIEKTVSLKCDRGFCEVE